MAEVVLGVDTHLEFHVVAVVLDRLGRRLGESKAPTTLKGYRNLLAWAKGFGPVRCASSERSVCRTLLACFKLARATPMSRS